MRIYKYKNKITKREAFYGNLKLLLQNEPIITNNGFLGYYALYFRLKGNNGRWEDDQVRIEIVKLNTGNAK